MDQYRPARHTARQPRRRSIGWLIPTLILVIIAAGWCAFWFYAADRAKALIAGWIEREQRPAAPIPAADQSLGGFPFRIEFRCSQGRCRTAER